MKIRFKDMDDTIYLTADLCYAHPDYDETISVLLVNGLSIVSLDGEFEVVSPRNDGFFGVYHPSYKRMVLLPKWACEEV